MTQLSGTTPRGGGARNHMIYVITCGMCGQSWQRVTAQDGQVIGCIFCGCQGSLRLGAAPPDGGAQGHGRTEAWLHVAGEAAE
ncbi:MAG: hypothetical protein HYV93_03645 [Candidatus Rokubacteria bacterium]|nr:hypothetical protein [Candidatus Rokubacteria bacterium]